MAFIVAVVFVVVLKEGCRGLTQAHTCKSVLTIIDKVSNFPELFCSHSKSAVHVGLQLEKAWLSCHPRPIYEIYGHCSEFVGIGFQNVLRRHNIRGHPTTVNKYKGKRNL